MRTNSLLFALTLPLLAIAAYASPADNRLLAMVPEDAQIISGMKLPLAIEAEQQLPLVVHNNNVDYDDWRALVSVDPRLSGRELVEVAASSPRGALAERLLLVDGTFTAARIYRAALQGGASAAEFAGVRVIVVLPFAREKKASLGVRWLAIPDDQTALFGTPLLVQKALIRRAAHAATNAPLAAHVSELRAGVEDWSIVTMPPDSLERHLGNACYAAAAIQTLIRTDSLVMGFRYGRSTATVDFVAHTAPDLPETLTALNRRAQLLAARFNPDSRVRLQRIAVDGHRVSGTLTINTIAKTQSTRELANR